MSNALVNDVFPAGARYTLVTTEGPPLEVKLGAGVGSFTPLAFAVTDDDGIVAANTVVSHILAVAGILATDEVIGVNVPPTPSGSGLLVTAAVLGAGSVQLNYKNVRTSGDTNGSTTYTVFVARFP